MNLSRRQKEVLEAMGRGYPVGLSRGLWWVRGVMIPVQTMRALDVRGLVQKKRPLGDEWVLTPLGEKVANSLLCDREGE